jgi:hypothetical protein
MYVVLRDGNESHRGVSPGDLGHIRHPALVKSLKFLEVYRVPGQPILHGY